MLAAEGAFRVFTDADLAYPPAEIGRILADLESGADVAIACRVLPESPRRRRSIQAFGFRILCYIDDMDFRHNARLAVSRYFKAEIVVYGIAVLLALLLSRAG